MTGTLASRLSALDQSAIFRELNSLGIFCAPSIFSEDELRQLRDDVSRLLTERGGTSFSIIESNSGVPAFARIADDPAFVGLMRSLALRACDNANIRKARVYNVLRVINCLPDEKSSQLVFHYDATVVTALVPIFIASGEPEEVGDFVCIPNRRSVHRIAIINLMEKVLMQNSVTRSMFAKRAKMRDPSTKIVRLVPGNLYLFWGYRTYHANFSCAPGRLRATLLFHFGDPHADTFTSRAILAVRKWRVKWNLG